MGSHQVIGKPSRTVYPGSSRKRLLTLLLFLQDQTMPTPDFTAPPGDDPGVPAPLADETVPCSIWICGPGGEALHLPDPCLDPAGTKADECRDTGWVGGFTRRICGQCSPAGSVLSLPARRGVTGIVFRGADGEYRTVASSGIPVRDAAGQVVLWVGVTLDITGRDEPGGQVRELWTLSAIARVIEEGDADPEEIFRRAACLLPRGFRHPERVSARVVPGTVAPGPGRIVAGHLVVECRERPEETGDPFLPQERDLVCAVAAMLEAAVAPGHGKTGISGQEYRLLFDHMLDAGLLLAILRDGSGSPAGFQVIQINHKAEEVLGRRREEVAGEDLAAVVPSTSPATLDLLYQVAGTGIPVHREVYDPALDACYELKAYRPEYDRLVVIADDITERRRAEEVLREQRIALDNRVRELAVLYSMTGIVERPGIAVEEVLTGGCRHPPRRLAPPRGCRRPDHS
ncbi:PAS domain-containing protein [Methanoculleus sp. 10]|uniref:PAS domain-containing protein n=1 Tax=Methanoculleus sp. 10 TaxID=430615 RepID=UPI0025EE3CA0|nr:PAS domain-containing protein [Methanoculleus sp. 10]